MTALILTAIVVLNITVVLSLILITRYAIHKMTKTFNNFASSLDTMSTRIDHLGVLVNKLPPPTVNGNGKTVHV